MDGRREGGGRSGRQVEAIAAIQAAVVGEHMAIQLFAELSAKGAAADASSQSAEDGAGEQAESHSNRAGSSANRSAGLAAREHGGGTPGDATDSTKNGADLRGRAERVNLGRATARALQ